MIKLFQSPPLFNAANPSPFCIKLEVLLKISGLPYEIVEESDPRKGPKGKIPYIEDKGGKIGDSGLISDYLTTTYNIDFHEGLSASERAVSVAFTRLLDEHLYWVMVYSRWMEDENWPVTSDAFFSEMPVPLRWIIPGVARKSVRSNLAGHGIGRHGVEDIYALGIEDLDACSGFLAGRDFAFGDSPTALDAAMYGQLSAIMDAPFASPLKDAALKHDNLVAFTKRMRTRFFPDL